MAKKVLILSSSPRRGGNSDLLCDRFLEGARKAGLEVEKIFLKDKKINYCMGCNRCYNGEHPCPQQDDAAEVVGKMVDADVIVMASPVYFYTVCGQMKTLIDRACARYTEMNDKEFYFILTAARAEHRDDAAHGGVLPGLPRLPRRATEKGVVYGVGAWHAGEIKSSPAMQEAYELGLRA